MGAIHAIDGFWSPFLVKPSICHLTGNRSNHKVLHMVSQSVHGNGIDLPMGLSRGMFQSSSTGAIFRSSSRFSYGLDLDLPGYLGNPELSREGSCFPHNDLPKHPVLHARQDEILRCCLRYSTINGHANCPVLVAVVQSPLLIMSPVACNGFDPLNKYILSR